MRIRVTRKDIEQGIQGNSFHCPVARAIQRALRAQEVWVREIIIVKKSGSSQTYVTPSPVENFIEQFDSALLDFEAPRPFSFTLEKAS